MGKGYNNYMCKKPFHPGSKANIKRAWMAEQKTENDKRKQEELKAQYEKEQNLYNNRALISSESKDKLELNFMYEAPPGAKRERQKEDDEPEFKFEWQRKYNAPREDYAKGNEDIKDQPFGIPVRNVRCIKCHKWGHINTDKECPLYNQASTSSMPTTSMDPMELMRQMKEDGYGLKENVLGHQLNPAAANQQFIPSDDEKDPEMEFLKSLSSADKKKLLKKLKKLSKKQEKSSNCKKKKKSKSKKTKKSKSRASFSSDSEKEKKAKKKKSKKSSSSDSDSSSAESDEEKQTKKSRNLEPEEKHSKSENKKPKGPANLQEPPVDARKSSVHKSQEKSNKEMFDENLNLDRYTSKEDIAHKKVQGESKKESSDCDKHKTKEAKNEKKCVNLRTERKVKCSSSNSDEERYLALKYESYRGERTEKNVKHFSSKSKTERYEVSKTETHDERTEKKAKHSTSNSKDERCQASKKETYHDEITEKKAKPSSSDSKEERYQASKTEACYDKRTEKRAKHSSSDSKEERYQALKTETHHDERTGQKDKHSSGDFKEKGYQDSKTEAHYDERTEKKTKNSSSDSKEERCQALTTETHYEERTETKVKHPSSNSEVDEYQDSRTETRGDDANSDAPKRKHKTSLCKEDSDVGKHASARKKVKSEPIPEDSSDHNKHKSKETKHDVEDSLTAPLHDDGDLWLPAPKRKREASEDDANGSKVKKGKREHPDGFSHLCPQALIKANYLQPSEEYEGKIHDEFRHHYREKRSPSVKQKYNN